MRVLDPWLDTPDDPTPRPAPTPPPAQAGRYAELTVDEMVEDHEDGPGLGAALDGIRCTRGDAGVSVTVNLYGRLVDLVLEPRAMRGRATDLAATIHRLTTEATAAAHAEAHTFLAPHVPFLPAPDVRPAG